MTNDIKQIRKDKGLTQSQLATMSGVSRKLVSSLENQTCNPTYRTLLALATALDCLITDFKIKSI